MNTNQRWVATLLALAGPLMVLGIWEALARSGVVNPVLYPPPPPPPIATTSPFAYRRPRLFSAVIWGTEYDHSASTGSVA